MSLFTRKIVAGIITLALGALIAGVLLIQNNCSNRQVSPQTRRYPHVHVPRADYEAGPELNALSYTMDKGDTLERLATLRYDHPYYHRIIKLSNDIKDENNIEVGTHLRLPNLVDLLIESGFSEAAPSETELILCSRAKYKKVKSELWALRRDATGKGVIVPEDKRLALLEAASDLEEAIDRLKADKPGVSQAPRMMIGQLEKNAASLRELAEGANDGYGYDLDMVEQRYALALSYGIIWAREGFE